MRLTPAVSVVIATFNGSSYLASQLRALEAESVADGFEVIIADNGSTDDTVAVARSFSDAMALVVVDASEVRGQSFARNAGAGAARGNKLIFLDQDDVIGARYLERMSSALDEHRVVAARMETHTLNADGMGDARQIAQTSELPTTPVPWAYGCTLGVRREAFDLVGGFATDQVGGAEDIDLCWRLNDVGVTVTYVPEAVVHYRVPADFRALFEQGRRYGRAAVLLYARRGLRDPMSSLDAWLKGIVWALLASITSPTRPRRGYAMFLLGRRVGEIEGQWRFRSATLR